jgi:hypothetical protein
VPVLLPESAAIRRLVGRSLLAGAPIRASNMKAIC